MAKGFDESAVVGPITPSADLTDETTYSLFVNDEPRQEAKVADMVWSPAQIIAGLSSFVALKAGDLIFTGTPEGVGPLVRGDRVRIDGAGLASLQFEMV